MKRKPSKKRRKARKTYEAGTKGYRLWNLLTRKTSS